MRFVLICSRRLTRARRSWGVSMAAGSVNGTTAVIVADGAEVDQGAYAPAGRSHIAIALRFSRAAAPVNQYLLWGTVLRLRCRFRRVGHRDFIRFCLNALTDIRDPSF